MGDKTGAKRGRAARRMPNVDIDGAIDIPELGELKSTEAIVNGDKPVNKRGRVIMSIVVVLLIVLVLIACAVLLNLLSPQNEGSTDTGGITWVRSIYAYGPEPEHLISPASCAVSPDGSSFWVADQNHFRIVEFNWNGSLRKLFDRDSEGNTLNFPSDIAVARDGTLYVAESSYQHVMVYDKNYQLLQRLEVPNPMSVAVNDEVVVVGARSGFVAFDRQGELIGYVGDHGKGEDEFDTINGIAIDDESNVYVVDTYNNRLSKYDREGDKVWMVGMGTPGNSGADARARNLAKEAEKYPAMLQQPMGITIDAAGRLIVIDSLEFTIAAFDAKDGSFLDRWGVFGAEDGQLAYSSDISYDRQRDWFVLTDTGNVRAQIVKLPGSGAGPLSGVRALLSGPLGACLIPLLLIVLAAILYAIWRYLNHRRKKEILAREQAIALEQLAEAHGYPLSSQKSPEKQPEEYSKKSPEKQPEEQPKEQSEEQSDGQTT